MNPEQQRIAIAEACGWTVLEPEVKPAITYLWGLRECFILEENKEIIPNYLNDLNAMHDAEELLYAKSDTLEGAERMRDYSKWLCNIAKYPLRATASQRAEAFLRTIGKWEESQ